MAPRGRARPAIGAHSSVGGIVDVAVRVRAAVLLDEAAEGVDLVADRHAGDVVARRREGGLQRPFLGLGVVDLVVIAVDTVAGIAGDDVDLALAFDDRVLAGRDRQSRLLDPAPGIGRLGRDAGDVALLLDGRRNVGDRAVAKPGEQRIGLAVGSSFPRLLYRLKLRARSPERRLSRACASARRLRGRRRPAGAPTIRDWAPRSSSIGCSLSRPEG